MGDPVPLLAALTGLGIIAFWSWGLSGGVSHGEEPWPGFRHHELAFALPDVLVGVGLLASAWFELRSGGGFETRLISAGALMFLGVLDLAYTALTWRLREGVMRWRTPVLAGTALLLGVYFALAP